MAITEKDIIELDVRLENQRVEVVWGALDHFADCLGKEAVQMALVEYIHEMTPADRLSLHTCVGAMRQA